MGGSESFDSNTSCAVVSLALVKQMPIKWVGFLRSRAMRSGTLTKFNLGKNAALFGVNEGLVSTHESGRPSHVSHVIHVAPKGAENGRERAKGRAGPRGARKAAEGGQSLELQGPCGLAQVPRVQANVHDRKWGSHLTSLLSKWSTCCCNAMASGTASRSPEGAMKGWLMKRSQQLLQWRWRYVSLTGRRLMTYTTEKEEVLTNEVEVTMELEVEVAEFYLAAPLKYGFMVMAREKTLRFAAESNELREEWIRAIANCAAGSVEAVDLVPVALVPEPMVAEAKKGPKGGPKGGPPPKGKGKSKGPKGPGKAPGRKGKTPLLLSGKGMPKASSLPLGRRLSVRLLTPGEAAADDGSDEGGSGGTASAKLEVDLEDLRQTFGASRSSSSKQTPRTAAHEVGLELLPRKEAQNVAIVLKSLRRKWSDLEMEGHGSVGEFTPSSWLKPMELSAMTEEFDDRYGRYGLVLLALFAALHLRLIKRDLQFGMTKVKEKWKKLTSEMTERERDQSRHFEKETAQAVICPGKSPNASAISIVN
eukprot:s73_g9.t1